MTEGIGDNTTRQNPHRRQQPVLYLVSALQEWNKCWYKDDPVWLQTFDENPRKSERHVRCCCAIYRHQIEDKGSVIHEHPWLARSWSLACIASFEKKVPRVERVSLDMRQHGMTSHWHTRGGNLGPVMRPTGMLTITSSLPRIGLTLPARS